MRVEGQEQLVDINVQRFQGGLEFQAHRLVNHSTLGSRVIKRRRAATLLAQAIQFNDGKGKSI